MPYKQPRNEQPAKNSLPSWCLFVLRRIYPEFVANIFRKNVICLHKHSCCYRLAIVRFKLFSIAVKESNKIKVPGFASKYSKEKEAHR